MRKEFQIFLTALMFYTRIPVPSHVDHSQNQLNKATRYFPLIGWIVGGISFLVYWISAELFGINVAIILSLITGVVITGGFHEDGLSDAADGFGGGWTKEKILLIMKDSRVGAFGAIALVLLFLLKYTAMSSLFEEVNEALIIALFFLSYHALARLTAINLVFISQYARADESSKAKPIAKAHGFPEIAGAYFFGLLPLAALIFYNWHSIIVLIPLTFLLFYARNYFNKKLGGYTGDCLGAVEQIAECLVLLAFLSL